MALYMAVPRENVMVRKTVARFPPQKSRNPNSLEEILESNSLNPRKSCFVEG